VPEDRVRAVSPLALLTGNGPRPCGSIAASIATVVSGEPCSAFGERHSIGNKDMIDIYFWTTPNGYKILLFAEEAGIAYRIVPVNISAGEQFAPDFLRISPNNRIPAIVDRDPAEGERPVSVFESGAILLYLAEKTGRFIPRDLAGRVETLQWLFWQTSGLGPMAGQNHHFRNYAPVELRYAIDRYVDETGRLYAVLNKRLADREFIAGAYGIADMAAYPWIVPHERQGQDLTEFPHLERWFRAVAARPAVQAAYEKGRAVNVNPTVTDEARRFLFGQSARSATARGAAAAD
jgi:GST-like protein